MGNSGSGKTTFSNALASKSKVGVIHVDELVGEAKMKYFRMFLQPKENNSTESTKKNPKLKAGAKEIFYKNRLLFRFLMKVRSRLVSGSIERKIEEFRNEGKELVVIDDWLVNSHKKLLPRLNHIYVMNRKYLERRKSLKERDALSREELNITDFPYALDFVKIPKGSNVTNIKNDGTIEDLKQKALDEYSKYVAPTFDERYKVEDGEITYIDMPKVVKVMKDINKAGKSSRSKES